MEIQTIHEEIFNYLQTWSNRSHSTDELNPYFYMRTQKDEHFKKGYWFPGNEDYMCLSFWAGGDSQNRTPNVYFEISKKQGIRVIVVAKDSDAKQVYFSNMIVSLNTKHSASVTWDKKNKGHYVSSHSSQTANLYTLDKNGKTFAKTYSPNFKDYAKYLDIFIKEDKILIDKYLEANRQVEFEDFISPFDFITPSDFDKMLSKVMTQRQIIESKYPIKTNQNGHNETNGQLQQALPFYLQEIKIENFQGIKSTSVNNLPSDANWIFVTGENGYGKTTFLQAVALGLDKSELETFMEAKTKIAISIGGKAVIIRSKGSTTAENDVMNRKIVGYGPSRLNIQAQTSENAETKSLHNTLSLFDNSALLKNINYELFASDKTNKTVFQDLLNIVKTLTKGRIANINIEGVEAHFTEKLSNGDLLTALPLSKLAAGFRAMINLVCDIYLRLKSSNTGLTYQNFEGIVLIDEIETHLHPILQKELAESLTAVFPKIQFIASTHSPIPLLGAPHNSIILKINRSNEDGVTIERLDEMVEFDTLLPNTILSSPIFGFQELIPNGKSPSQFVRVETTYNEVQKNNLQQAQITQLLSNEN
jgi:predicted ATPase